MVIHILFICILSWALDKVELDSIGLQASAPRFDIQLEDSSCKTNVSSYLDSINVTFLKTAVPDSLLGKLT